MTTVSHLILIRKVNSIDIDGVGESMVEEEEEERKEKCINSKTLFVLINQVEFWWQADVGKFQS